jgi:hypothetical protein
VKVHLPRTPKPPPDGRGGYPSRIGPHCGRGKWHDTSRANGATIVDLGFPYAVYSDPSGGV